MKVTLEKDYRKCYTLEELDMAKAVIKAEKEDDTYTAKEWAEYAAREALRNELGCLIEVIRAEAEMAKNCRAWNNYNEESGNIDVWIRFIAETTKGFIRGGAYLSDIWNTGSVEYKQHMYIRTAEWNED